MLKSLNSEDPQYLFFRNRGILEIRKDNREKEFVKRRSILPGEEVAPDANCSEFRFNESFKRLLIVDDRYSQFIYEFLVCSYTVDMLPDLIELFLGDDLMGKHQGLIGIRKILSLPKSPPIQEVIDAGLISPLLALLQQSEYPQLQLEATWTLTNVASGTSDQCERIIDKGGVPIIISLLDSPHSGVVEQAIWALGNIGSDCMYYRDLIIKEKGITKLVKILGPDRKPANAEDDEQIIRYGCWSLSNLCRGHPLPEYQKVKAALPVLCCLVAGNCISDLDIVADVCWAVSYHSDGQKKRAGYIIQSGMLEKIFELLDHHPDNYSMVIPCVRIIGNISTGSSQYTQILHDLDAFRYLGPLLYHRKNIVRREAAWVISNLIAGSELQVKNFLEKQGPIINRLIEMFTKDKEDIKREICFIFSNITYGGKNLDLFSFYKQKNIIELYLQMMRSTNTDSVEVATKTFFQILRQSGKNSTKKNNPAVNLIAELGELKLLQQLQYHKSDTVYFQISKILKTFFDVADPLDDHLSPKQSL